MHIVPAPAESLMKSRVLSIPGLQGVMDKGSAAFQTFRERSGTSLRVKPNEDSRLEVCPFRKCMLKHSLRDATSNASNTMHFQRDNF